MARWILAGLGSLGSSFIGSLMGKISDYVIERVSEDPGVADLHKLRNTLSGTERIIGRVENMWIKDDNTKKRLKELLMKLKDTVYEADDLLDEIQFRVLKQQIEQQGAQGYEASNQSSSSSDLPPSIKRKFSERVGRLFGREDDVIRVREIQMTLDEYTTDIEHFIDKLDDDEKQMITSVVPRTTTSFPIETQVFGRDEQLNHLLEQLMKSADGSGSSNSSISTLTIVGIGGVGKTTLAQQAYNHERVKNYFQHEVWVCVSDNFNVERLTKEIIESITENKCDLSNLDTLQVVLKKNLTSKRFLLVLDDVWNEDSLKWERFCAPLRYGEPGSKILVTTRSKKIAEMVGNPIPLGGLAEASYWKLFKKCAFGSEDAGEFPHLEAIAKKIAGRLKGLPLAARTVGGLLKTQMNEEHWRIIAGSEIWQLQQDEQGVLPVLQLSYQCLPSHLKQCFVFCSLFLKDLPFDERDLIRLWMAEGYVAQNNNVTMEDTGSRYFLDLVNRFFFQEAPVGSKYVMHDLIHDLAQFISEGEFCRIDDDEWKEIPNTTRHLSVIDGTNFLEFYCNEKLRTLMINYKIHWYVDSSLFLRFERLKNIRVLILQSCGLWELPETIGGSIHLRYLDISHNIFFSRLPESLFGLYNLRVLNLLECALQSLPYGMSKLINLMHLNAEDKIISEINDVGKLTSLRGLSSFKVLKDQGHEVAQLGSLKQLHGQLRITNLENVESKQEAGMANLNNKQYLDALALEWTSDDGSSLDGNELVVLEEVFEGLQPLQALKSLTIRGYNGVRSPSWLQAQSLTNLATLRLINCKAWKDLSCIGQLPNLKNFYVEGMPAVKQISHELSTESKFLHNLEMPDQGKCFPCLEELTFKDMPEWEEWSCADGRQLFPYLQNLKIVRCPRLKRMPPLPPSLKSLSLCQVGLTEVLEDIPKCEGLPCLDQLPSLKVLRIERMPVFPRDQRKYFPSLEELTFRDMPEWEEWSWADGRQLFPCLRKLEIKRCPKLKRMPPLPPSLESLLLSQVGLTEVPRLLEEIDGSSSSMTVSELKIYSLKKVEMEDIPECEGLPCLGQLPSLKVLRIERMPAVKKVGDGFFGSRDQSKCFPSLKELTIRDMPQWEEWSWADGRQLFPCLRKLEIKRCPKLKRMPPLPPSLESLLLSQVGLTEVPRLWEEIDGSSSSMTVSELKIYSLKKVKLEDIPECEGLPCLGQLPSLKVLRIERMPTVKKVGDGFFGSRDQSKCFPSLKELTIRDMPQWEEWSWADGRQLFPCLRKLQIERCPRLKRMPLLPPLKTLRLCEVGLTEVAGLREGIHGGGICVTASRSSLEINQCPNLRNLQEGLLSHSFPNIGDIAILECAELVLLPVKEFKELTSLEKLSICSCPKLLSMTRDGDINICLPPSIKELVLSDCGNLGKLLLGCLHNLTSLTRLEIGDCRCIESLPATSLLHLKRLQYLKFWKCGELRSKDELLLNEGNEQVEGSSVTELCIDDTALFKLSLLRRTLPSVRALRILNFHRATMSDEEEQLLRSLTALRVLEFEDCKNLQSLPRELHAFPSICLLIIIGCPEIQSLPEKGLPTSLRNLIFVGCHPMLSEQLKKHLDEMKSSGRFLALDRLEIHEDKRISSRYVLKNYSEKNYSEEEEEEEEFSDKRSSSRYVLKNYSEEEEEEEEEFSDKRSSSRYVLKNYSEKNYSEEEEEEEEEEELSE
ncbi:LOW QUALITY PROTEIN: putative disease resistance RPP13-like protein 1 [Musa acuminata AAA Group]|uniref:LOW QUALITY PROTEIN: putative disease resistance RPP13-like protein 1 n=1 Tax=Musa acuminata AAA Group TaxID=214697 RepID=UPI0031E07750